VYFCRSYLKFAIDIAIDIELLRTNTEINSALNGKF